MRHNYLSVGPTFSPYHRQKTVTSEHQSLRQRHDFLFFLIQSLVFSVCFPEFLAMVSAEVANAIWSAKAKYCRYIDTKQWRSLEAISLPNATFSFLNPDGSIQKSGSFRFDYISPEDFVRDLQGLFRRARTLHHVGAGELKKSENGDVEAIWCMEDQIIYPPILGIFPLEVRGGGYYHETWQCEGNSWKLKSLKLERTYVQPSLAARLLSPLSSLL